MEGFHMLRVLRSVFGVIVGFVLASVVMMAFEFANGHFFYPDLAKLAEAKDKEAAREALANAPETTAADSREVLIRRREAVKEVMAAAPVGALLVVLVGWFVGSVAGGWLAAWIAGRAAVVHALVLGGLLTLAGIANNLMLPPPLWFWICTVVVFLPATYAGARLVPQQPLAGSASA